MAMTYNDRKNVIDAKRQQVIDNLLDSMQNNPTAWRKGWFTLPTLPTNGKTHQNYRGVNALNLSFIAEKRGYKDNRWVTFNQAKELGASVKAGQKSSDVMFWSQYDRNTKKQFDLKTVAGMSDEEKNEYIKEYVKPVLKFFSVFNAEQCENFPERTEQKMSEEEMANKNTAIEKIIANSAAPIFHDTTKAYYVPSLDEIHLPKEEMFFTERNYYATALHEIAHSTGHSSRLNRDLSGVFGSSDYAMEELRAELSSVFMQTDLGIDLGDAEIGNHGAYLSSWMSAIKEDPDVFYKAVSDASKIVTFIKENYLEAGSKASISRSKATVVTLENFMADNVFDNNASTSEMEL